MKAFQLNQTLESNPPADQGSYYLRISKRIALVFLLVLAVALVITFPVAIYPIIAIVLGWAILYCYRVYQDISSLNFTDQNYSISLEEIIDDLNG